MQGVSSVKGSSQGAGLYRDTATPHRYKPLKTCIFWFVTGSVDLSGLGVWDRKRVTDLVLPRRCREPHSKTDGWPDLRELTGAHPSGRHCSSRGPLVNCLSPFCQPYFKFPSSWSACSPISVLTDGALALSLENAGSSKGGKRHLMNRNRETHVCLLTLQANGCSSTS